MTEDQAYQASLEFYHYESRYRGWYHFDFPVPLEVPYHPFERREPKEYTDDGKVPSLLKRLFQKGVDTRVEEEEQYYDFPERVQLKSDFCILILSFSERPQVSRMISIEFLNMLSLGRDPMSFEIIGTGDDITIQLTCSEYDRDRVEAHVSVYFPDATIQNGKPIYESLPFSKSVEDEIVIVDFGLESEMMLPLQTSRDFTHDPLTSVVAQFEQLRTGSVAVLQILFQGVRTPLAKDIMYSVSDGMGGSFFSSDPEMLEGAKEKTTQPLFACVIRLATQGTDSVHSEYLAKELISSISYQSDSGVNKLIPMPNKDYDYMNHVANLFHRSTNRVGMILNTEELVEFVHYPNSTIPSKKLGGAELMGKLAPLSVQNNPYQLGVNVVGDTQLTVSLTDEQRLSHTHIIGVTGMGKSTLLSNMFLQDVELGLGGVLFDPHGDIVEDILVRIPEHRMNDVILLDPSDTDFPLGFNLLHAESEAERLVLSSDLVSAFRKYATAWGDRMTSVLANAIDTFLASEKGGTLIELKRFLLEKSFREQFLQSVNDPQLQYYWKHDYSLVSRNSLSPLLTRIDTFLRPKIIRMMFAQKSGLDLADIVNGNKILLVKLSQGLIGQSNAHLLGTLLVSKLSQVALGRQAIPKSERTHFYLYMDEFHHLMTDSIADMLSGSRKYGIGLVLAHQNMKQLSSDSQLAESIISNPHVRVCFRLGDTDARQLEQGFSAFDMNDLQSLTRGKAIMRVGGASNDFNIAFPKAQDEPENGKAIRSQIIDRTRERYGKPKEEVEAILLSLLPSFDTKAEEPKAKAKEEKPTPPEPVTKEEVVEVPVERISEQSFTEEAEKWKERGKKKRLRRKHEQLKVEIGTFAQEQGFRIVYEEETEDGGRVDIGLHNKEVSIACEVSVTNTSDYEVKNIQKCLKAGYHLVCVLTTDIKHQSDIQKKANGILIKQEQSKVCYLSLSELKDCIVENKVIPKPQEKIIKGYRVKVRYSDTDNHKAQEAKEKIAKTMLDSLNKRKKK